MKSVSGRRLNRDKGLRVELTRRQLLAGVSALTVPFAPLDVMAQSTNARTVFIVLMGLEELQEQALPQRILDSFQERTIPISIVVNLSVATERVLAKNKQSKSILSAAIEHPGLIEAVVGHRGVESTQRYLQLRAATKQRSALAQMMNVSPTEVEEVVSIYDFSQEDILEPNAYRAAGFRVLIRPHTEFVSAGRTVIEPLSWGSLRINGGIHQAFSDDPAVALDTIERTEGPHLLVLDASLSAHDLTANAVFRWVDALNTAFGRGQVIPTRPSDFMLLGNPGASKMMALAFNLNDLEQPSTDILDFALLLEEIGVPYSFIAPERPDGAVPSAGFCTTQAANLDKQFAPSQACLWLGAEQTTIADSVAAEIVVSSNRTNWRALGPQEDGRFHFRDNAAVDQTLLQRLQSRPLADELAIITPIEINTRFRRVELLRTIQEANSNGQIKFLTIDAMRDAMAAPDPVLGHFWSTRRRFSTSPPTVKTSTLLERAKLREDARLAWAYIERFTRNDTGLCAGTVQAGPTRSVISNSVTLWDLASQINGTIAAHGLEFIAEDEAKRRIKRILESVPTISIEGSRLPPSLFDAATLRPLQFGYDACDAGRFLIAIERAVSAGLASSVDVELLLMGWDLDETIQQSHPFSYTQKGWQDTFASHCTHYIRRGFTFAGHSIDTPYPALSVAATGDERITLLYSSATLGHIGPEPALLEAVEGQQSPEARYLADVLFDAQLRRFEQTDAYRVISEVPINTAPWFVYQGLRVDLPENESWIIKSTLSDIDVTSDSRLESKRMISTKAIFLWAATYAHPFCDELLALARNHARLPGYGYASGLQEDDLTRMEGYSDLNTNGIILTAIGHMLR